MSQGQGPDQPAAEPSCPASPALALGPGAGLVKPATLGLVRFIARPLALAFILFQLINPLAVVVL